MRGGRTRGRLGSRGVGGAGMFLGREGGSEWVVGVFMEGMAVGWLD